MLLVALIFFAPTNLFYKFSETGSFVHGLQIDYLIGKLYLSQLPLFGLLGLWLSDKSNWTHLHQTWQQPHTRVAVILFFLIGLRQWFSPVPLIGIWQWLSIASVALLVLSLTEDLTLLRAPIISAAIALTVVFQSAVGIAQFQQQHELIGYRLLGEPELSNYIGLARITIFGADRVLPYGTTAHPNVLAGFLAIYCVLVLTRWKNSARVGRVFLSTALLLGVVTLLITTSVSGITAFVLGVFVLLAHQKLLMHLHLTRLVICTIIILIPLGIHFATILQPQAPSLDRREYLQIAGLGMFLDAPLWGTGLQTATRYIEDYSTTSEIVRFSQPPHHMGILVLAEAGLLGAILLFLLLLTEKQFLSLLILAPIVSLDHYLLTLVPGIVLAGLCILLLCYDSSNSD